MYLVLAINNFTNISIYVWSTTFNEHGDKQMKTLKDGNNTVVQNEIIFPEGQNAQSIGILLRGKVDVFLSSMDPSPGSDHQEIMKKSFRLFTISQNIFLGINDLYMSSKYSFSYRAVEETCLHIHSIENHGQLLQLLKSRKEYAAYFVTSLSHLIDRSFLAYSNLRNLSQYLGTLTHNLSVLYWALQDRTNVTCKPAAEFLNEAYKNYEIMKQSKKQFPTDFRKEFLERDHADLPENELFTAVDLDEMKVKYYAQLLNLSAELRRDFFGSDDIIVGYHCYDASKCLQDLQLALKSCFKTAEEYLHRLYSPDGPCLLQEFMKLLEKTGLDRENRTHILCTTHYIIDKIHETARAFEEQYAYKTGINLKTLDGMLDRLLDLAGQTQEESTAVTCNGDETDRIPEELEDSMEKILEYSGISMQRAELLRTSLALFRSMEDKNAYAQESAHVRNAMTAVFFEVYEAVLKRVLAEKNKSRLYHMFLNFAYMDERLLEPKQVRVLYECKDIGSGAGVCSVYSMQDWLEKIAAMEKDPSMNEFQEDYFDCFRSMKKRGEVSDKDKPAYDGDAGRRLNYEIVNMFKTNHRLCHGRITNYFPVLHQEMITCDITRAIVNAERIHEGLTAILKVDFSAFYRELSYQNPQKGIQKLFIMKEVMPDIILMPIFGSRPIMWQEITGRSRGTPARLLIPALSDMDIDDLMVTLVGNLRWELCRTMMGVSWNDITQKSLTSEYTDYIQFFHKNSDLHDDVKAKIKIQIQKYHNKTKDIFTSDYRSWIENESNGIMRLNKTARGILYRNCPFPKEIRSNLEKHPAFGDMAVKFNIERAKLVRQLEGQYRQLYKKGMPLEPELEENLRFYKDL
jgi:hypothetical protein